MPPLAVKGYKTIILGLGHNPELNHWEVAEGLANNFDADRATSMLSAELEKPITSRSLSEKFPAFHIEALQAGLKLIPAWTGSIESGQSSSLVPDKAIKAAHDGKVLIIGEGDIIFDRDRNEKSYNDHLRASGIPYAAYDLGGSVHNRGCYNETSGGRLPIETLAAIQGQEAAVYTVSDPIKRITYIGIPNKRYSSAADAATVEVDVVSAVLFAGAPPDKQSQILSSPEYLEAIGKDRAKRVRGYQESEDRVRKDFGFPLRPVEK
jgi:hypothetical protein